MRSKLFFLMLIASMALFSCNNDDDQPVIYNVPQATVYQFKDKWWYSTDNSTSDLKFNSNGTYQSNYVFNGTNVVSNGQWEWMDEPNKIFRVYNLTNNQTDEYFGKVTALGSNNMSMKVSFDSGATYTENASPFLDVNN